MAPPDPDANHPMPAPTTPPPRVPPGPPPLGYRDVRDDRAGGTKRFLVHMLGGFAVAVLVCGACFGLLVAVGGQVMNNGQSAKSASVAAIGWTSLAVVTATLVGLVWWAVRAHRRRARTGFLVGMLIGVGLSLLPLGLCYAIIGGEAMR